MGESLTGNRWELEGYLEGTLSPPGTRWDGICGPDLAWGPLPSCQSWLRSAAGARPRVPRDLQAALLRDIPTKRSNAFFHVPPGSAVLCVLCRCLRKPSPGCLLISSKIYSEAWLDIETECPFSMYLFSSNPCTSVLTSTCLSLPPSSLPNACPSSGVTEHMG